MVQRNDRHQTSHTVHRTVTSSQPKITICSKVEVYTGIYIRKLFQIHILIFSPCRSKILKNAYHNWNTEQVNLIYIPFCDHHKCQKWHFMTFMRVIRYHLMTSKYGNTSNKSTGLISSFQWGEKSNIKIWQSYLLSISHRPF